MLGKKTKDIFGKKAESIRLKATEEFDAQIRSGLYKQFSILAEQQVLYIPGWIPVFFEIRSSKISKKQSCI
ncbi:MAG: hypothetical protein HUU56_07790 [Bdellovibrionaceae bacterium]|nr:hypothetical protein [Pseudobdellovibrionaceae bacterium]